MGESALVNQCMRYLSAQENVGEVMWFSRLQSGCVRVVKGYKGKQHQHYMHLCRKGTPDIMAILKGGRVLWLELKTKTGKVRDGQAEFRDMIMPIVWHHHLIIRDIKTLEAFFDEA